MALKPCRECKKKVSTEASTCPNCGVPNPTIKSIKKDKRVNIQNGTQYCSECGIELASGPPCTNPNGCRLAKISPWEKKKIDADNIRSERINNKKLAIDKYYADKTEVLQKKIQKQKEYEEKMGFAKFFNKHLSRSQEDAATQTAYNQLLDQNKHLNKQKNQGITAPNRDLFSLQFSLPVSFWFLFVGGNVFFNSIVTISNDEFAIYILVVHFMWATFAVVKTFESANIYKENKISQGLSYGWATAAKIVSVLALLGGLGNFFKTLGL